MLKEIGFCLRELRNKWKQINLPLITVKICNAFLTQNKHHIEIKLDIAIEELTVTAKVFYRCYDI